MQSKNIFCVDIGGTKTAFGVYDENGKEIFYHLFPTNPSEGAQNLIDRIYAISREWLNSVSLGVIASPGPLEVASGKIKYIATMGWREVPIVALFEQKLGFKFLLLNDCDAGALGVWKFFGFEQSKTLCYASISTGIGGGTVIDGKLFTGSGNASNFGHIPTPDKGLKCPCSQTDCVELYASGSGIENRYYALTGEKKECKEIYDEAKRGNAFAISVFDDAGKKLAQALSCVYQVLSPEVIVLGGSVCNASELFLPTVKDTLKGTKIEVVLSGKQVILGALAFGLQNLD